MAPDRKTTRNEQKRRMAAVIACFVKAQPDPHCELFYQTPYQLLVSVVLSAQATDKSVNRCMQPLYTTGLDPSQMLALGYAAFLDKIRSIGLAPTKAKNIMALTKILVEKHGGEVPRLRAALLELPGVGAKSANVILGELFQEPTLAVDTHVFRVTARLGLHAAKSPDKAEAALLNLIDKKYLPRAHHWFVLHGRYVCKAARPDCAHCILATLCPSCNYN